MISINGLAEENGITSDACVAREYSDGGKARSSILGRLVLVLWTHTRPDLPFSGVRHIFIRSSVDAVSVVLLSSPKYGLSRSCGNCLGLKGTDSRGPTLQSL